MSNALQIKTVRAVLHHSVWRIIYVLDVNKIQIVNIQLILVKILFDIKISRRKWNLHLLLFGERMQ